MMTKRLESAGLSRAAQVAFRALALAFVVWAVSPGLAAGPDPALAPFLAPGTTIGFVGDSITDGHPRRGRSGRVDRITGYPERICDRNGFHQMGETRFCRIPLISKIFDPVILSNCSY